MSYLLPNLRESLTSFPLGEYACLLRERKAAVFTPAAAALTIVLPVALLHPTTYRATGKVLIEPPSYVICSVCDTDPLEDLLRQNAQYPLPTQVDVLQSPWMQRQVSTALECPAPEFTVRVEDGTSIIDVTATGSDPRILAGAVDTLMHLYADRAYAQRGKELRRALQAQMANVDAARNQVRQWLLKVKAVRPFGEPSADALESLRTAQANLDRQSSMADDLQIRLKTLRRPARILVPARTTVIPPWRWRLRILLSALLSGLAAGLGLASLLELFSSRSSRRHRRHH